MKTYAKACFVPGCKSGLRSTRKYNKKNGLRNPTLFSAPKDPKLLQLWELAICRLDRPLCKWEVVCELHFKEDHILKFYETKLPDGSIDRLDRSYYTLKKNAIPSIFPPPSCQKSNRKIRGCPVALLKAPSTEDCDVSEIGEGCGMVGVETELFDFQVLVTEALNIILPSDMWTVGVLKGNQVIFANWSDGETFEARKRVLVDADLNVKIFFGNINAALDNMKEVHSLAEVSAFLIVIDQLKFCPSTRSPKCLGYVTPRDEADGGTSAATCRNCQRAEKDLPKQDSGKEVVSTVGLQSKILKKSLKSSQLCDLLHKKKKRKVLPEEGVNLDGKPPPEGAVKQVSGKACAEGDGDTDTVEEVDIEVWAPPPEWRSLATPLRLLNPPPEDTIRSTSTPSEAVESWEEFLPPLDVETLVRDANRIPLPSDAWTLGVVKGKRLIFASWKEGKVLEAEKRLVVDEDLNVKVVFGNVILALDEIRSVKKIEDIGRYLYIVDKMRKCNGIGTDRRAASCPGYFIPGQVRGVAYCFSRCAFCQGASEEFTRIRRMKGELVKVRAEAQDKAWRNLRKLSGLYSGMKKGVKASA